MINYAFEHAFLLGTSYGQVTYSYNNKPSYVKWSRVCTPKAAGGLGFRNIHLWNILTLGKYVWVVEKKLDNL